jgi:hypothetical protein
VWAGSSAALIVVTARRVSAMVTQRSPAPLHVTAME